MKKNKKINVLGTNYEIVFVSQSKMKELADDCPPGVNCWGLCDSNVATIYLDERLDKDGNAFKHILRHELTHAIFYESGLDSQCDFAICEQLVDWLAIQFPKIANVFKEAGAI